MEPWLWRWSTLFVMGSALVIAGYFIVLARSVRRPEVHAWMLAWLANLAALAIAIAFWPTSSTPAVTFSIVTSAYFFAKTQFVVLLVAGATGVAREQPRPVPHGRFSLAIAVFSAICGVVVGTLDRVGMVQSISMGAILLAGAITVSRSKTPAWQWLAAGFVLRMLLAAAETDGYAFESAGRVLPGWLDAFLDWHAVCDTAAEWIIALGCIFALRRKET